MGAFDRKESVEPEVETEQAPGAPAGPIEIHGQGYQVIARTTVTDEDELWVISTLLNTVVNQGRTQMSESAQLQLADRLWLQRLIISWTLPIPLDPDRAKAIGSLSQVDQDYLYQMIMAAQPKKKEKLLLGLGMKGPSPALKQALQKRAKRFNGLIK
jgi:hypothetical protein